MSAGLVIIKKELNGEEFVNTYGIYVGDDSVPLTEADLEAMVDPTLLGADQNVAVSPKVINALLDFEMGIMRTSVNFTNVYVTDGRNTQPGGDPTTIFYSKNLNVTGNVAIPAGGALAPGNVTLMVSTVPAGFSNRQGRKFYRGVLTKADIGIGGPKLVGWQDQTAATQYENLVAGSLTASGLSNHLVVGSAVAGGVVAIPHYQKVSDPATPQDGNLIGATGILRFQVGGPTGRQVAKGRKEK